ncbi:hypothetical protein [Bifidobacterium miconisargentati]|uniref:hypothetical protein n=1 Tax=Bifidobacterium miconisargentati TaxID=2834437 RepID=UPI001BDD68BE|nr:hypothetical protein [Bifidobacterium miconisargentati]MBW3090409.1 hypothetical protein [Bifidobacterium miconisargentati]
MLASINIADIIGRTIVDYDLKDEDGVSPTDDLYMIRSSQLDDLCTRAALRILHAEQRLRRRVEQEAEEEDESDGC